MPIEPTSSRLPRWQPPVNRLVPLFALLLAAASSCTPATLPPQPPSPIPSATRSPRPAQSSASPTPLPWSTVPPLTPSPTVPVVALANLPPGLILVTLSDRGLFTYDLQGHRIGLLVEGFFGSPALHMPTRQLADSTTDGHLKLLNLDTAVASAVAADTWPFRPSWSPDGRMLAAMTLTPDQLLPGIGVISLDTEEFTPIAASEINAWAAIGPVWSPDGKWIAFTQGPPHGSSDLMLVPTDCLHANPPCTPIPHRIPTAPDGPSFYDPSWSPDSTRLVAGCSTVRAGEPDNALCLVDVGSGITTTILHNPPDFTSPSRPLWSPDGSLIAFQDYSSIYTLSPISGHTTLILSAPYEELAFWISPPE